MLVLTRRTSESITIPACELTVTVLSIRGRSVRLGVSAPRTVQVHRSELIEVALPPGASPAANLPLRPSQ